MTFRLAPSTLSDVPGETRIVAEWWDETETREALARDLAAALQHDVPLSIAEDACKGAGRRAGSSTVLEPSSAGAGGRPGGSLPGERPLEPG